MIRAESHSGHRMAADCAKSATEALQTGMRQALAFDAPYVIERLLKDGVADTHTLADEVFSEVKKYLVLCELTPGAAIGMYSGLVDAAWHTFILFTPQYTSYSQRHFGRYLDHVPTVDESRYQGRPRPGAPVVANNVRGQGGLRNSSRANSKKLTFPDFRDRYEAVFGQSLPDVWYDERCISPNRRMIRDDRRGQVWLARHDGYVEVRCANGATLIRVNELAYAALQFILVTATFYVRELPGGLAQEEKVGLTQALTQSGVLKIAS
ncbi:glycine-rich domain-containing protein [Mycobacterium pseudokansasii]|nr:hypothetical protein [Mycobacterium pseudokansasii]